MANTVLRSGASSAMDDYPLWMDKAAGDPDIPYSALTDRTLIDALFIAEGPIGTTSWIVTQRAAGANFSVDISAGKAAIQGDDIANQGKYIVRSIGVVNLATPGAPASGTRTHRLVARVYEESSAGGSASDWTFELLEDTGSGTPAQPASAVTLATVAVSAGQASVTNAHIVDQRSFARSPGTPYLRHYTFTSPGTPMVFAGIPSTLRHVEILMAARSTSTAPLDDLYMRVNGVSSGVYHTIGAETRQATLFTYNQTGLTAALISTIPGQSATTSLAGRLLLAGWSLSPVVIDRLSWTFESGQYVSDVNSRVFIRGGSMVIAPPYTEVRLFPNSGNFAAQSSFTLIGWD